MKKRMLVTTIALVLVIAVALTTSSLAWFSSSSTVTTSELTFVAAEASGTNLVLGNYGEIDLAKYKNTVPLNGGADFNPVQGKVSFVGIAKSTDNRLALATNPFYASSKVVQVQGYDVIDQKVTFAKASDDQYLAGGFNFANANGYEIPAAVEGVGGVSVKATITLATEDDISKTVDAENKVKKGYIAYDGGAWYSAGQAVTASAVFFKSQDVALLASIRIAVCGATDVIKTDGETVSFEAAYDDGKAQVYGWGTKGVTLGNGGGYAVAAGGNQNRYVDSEPTNGEKTYNDHATAEYAETITGITYDAEEGVFTFSYTFADKISADNAGSIAFVIWVDGWDESALPGVSQGTFKIEFTLSK